MNVAPTSTTSKPPVAPEVSLPCPLGADAAQSNAVRDYAAKLGDTAACGCDQKRVTYAFFLFGIVIVAAVYGVVLFLRGIKYAKEFLNSKVQLKETVKTMAKQTSTLIASTLPPSSPPATTTNPSTSTNSTPSADSNSSNDNAQNWGKLWRHLDAIEKSSSAIKDTEKSHFFVMGYDGKVFAHGDSKVLKAEDRSLETDNLMISASKDGGRYLYFSDRKDRPMACYCYPVKGYPLLVGGVFRVPENSQARVRLLIQNRENPEPAHRSTKKINKFLL